MRGKQDRPVYIRHERKAGPTSGPATAEKKKKKKQPPAAEKKKPDTAEE